MFWQAFILTLPSATLLIGYANVDFIHRTLKCLSAKVLLKAVAINSVYSKVSLC